MNSTLGLSGFFTCTPADDDRVGGTTNSAMPNHTYSNHRQRAGRMFNGSDSFGGRYMTLHPQFVERTLVFRLTQSQLWS